MPETETASLSGKPLYLYPQDTPISVHNTGPGSVAHTNRTHNDDGQSPAFYEPDVKSIAPGETVTFKEPVWLAGAGCVVTITR
jgi:hypothetical protein